MFNKEKLKKILSLQSVSGKEKEQINNDIIDLLKQIETELNIKLTINIDDIGNIFVIKGKKDLYPCIISHSDNVGKYIEEKKIIENDGYLFAISKNKQVDCHADDKVGMYMCFQLLMDLPYCKVCFFISEEIGCIGSSKADLTFFKDCMFVLQADRKGNSDWIYHSNGQTLYGEEFNKFIIPYLISHNYKEERGILTDVGELTKRNIGIATSNISCGYYNAHCDNSYCTISEVENCYNLMFNICTAGIKNNKKYEYFNNNTIKDIDISFEDIFNDYLNNNKIFLKDKNRIISVFKQFLIDMNFDMDLLVEDIVFSMEEKDNICQGKCNYISNQFGEKICSTCGSINCNIKNEHVFNYYDDYYFKDEIL